MGPPFPKIQTVAVNSENRHIQVRRSKLLLDRGVQPHQKIERRRLLHPSTALNDASELLGWIAAEVEVVRRGGGTRVVTRSKTERNAVSSSAISVVDAYARSRSKE